MGLSYETGGSIAKPDSNAVVLALPFVSRGFLLKLIAVQDAKNANFTVDVFNKNPSLFAGLPENLYKVLPTLTSGSPTGVVEFFGGSGIPTPHPFHSQDALDAAGKIPATLYIRISGTATGTIYVQVAGIKTRP